MLDALVAEARERSGLDPAAGLPVDGRLHGEEVRVVGEVVGEELPDALELHAGLGAAAEDEAQDEQHAQADEPAAEPDPK